MPGSDTMNILLLLGAVITPAVPLFLLEENGTDFIVQEDGTSLIQLENTAHG